jgi:hypothetical protein
MRWLNVPCALIVGLATVASVSADNNDQGKKKLHLIHGRVEAVQKDADKDAGRIEVLVHHHKKGKTGKGESKLVTIKVTPDTKFEIVHREGKGNVDRKPATFADVHKGERVAIVPMEGAREVAQRVEIVIGKKGKPAGGSK